MIWNLRLRPRRERSAGVAVVMSAPSKRIVPSLAKCAPASAFSSVLLPEPFGPISP